MESILKTTVKLLIGLLFGAILFAVVAFDFPAQISRAVRPQQKVAEVAYVPTNSSADTVLQDMAITIYNSQIDKKLEIYQPQKTNNLIYKYGFTELPLYWEDYYWGKFENAKAGVQGLNTMPILKPGDRKSVVREKFINVKPWNGYIQPQSGYYFASGVCWSTSTLGTLMDNINVSFRNKYGIDLFIFNYGDRSGHIDAYTTYNGYGYAVLQISEGVPGQDYSFTVNPDVAKIKSLKGLKLKIIMTSTDKHSWGANGYSIAGYIATNKPL